MPLPENFDSLVPVEMLTTAVFDPLHIALRQLRKLGPGMTIIPMSQLTALDVTQEFQLTNGLDDADNYFAEVLGAGNIQEPGPDVHVEVGLLTHYDPTDFELVHNPDNDDDEPILIEDDEPHTSGQHFLESISITRNAMKSPQYGTMPYAAMTPRQLERATSELGKIFPDIPDIASFLRTVDYAGSAVAFAASTEHRNEAISILAAWQNLPHAQALTWLAQPDCAAREYALDPISWHVATDLSDEFAPFLQDQIDRRGAQLAIGSLMDDMYESLPGETTAEQEEMRSVILATFGYYDILGTFNVHPISPFGLSLFVSAGLHAAQDAL